MSKFGATKKFPQGKLRQDDEGELRFGVAVAGSKVVVNFGKPVAWLGMDADLAETFGHMLIEKAREARKGGTA